MLSSAAFFGAFTAGMSGTSINLTVNNLTQVELLGAKTRVHVLAVLEPQREGVAETNSTYTPESSYHEITYPLRAYVPKPHDLKPLSAELPRTRADPHTRPFLPTTQNSGSAEQETTGMPDILDPITLPTTTAELVEFEIDSSQPTEPRGSTNQVHAGAKGRVPGPLDSQTEKYFRTTGPSKEKLSERDRRATRTFAVLRMPEPGSNPWNLGSMLLNWETVMGDCVIDWFLPIKRSPCCDHSGESHFRVGPSVEHLRSVYGFAAPEDRREKSDLKPSQFGIWKRKKRRGPNDTAASGSVIKLDHLNGSS